MNYALSDGCLFSLPKSLFYFVICSSAVSPAAGKSNTSIHRHILSAKKTAAKQTRRMPTTGELELEKDCTLERENSALNGEPASGNSPSVLSPFSPRN